MKRSLQKLLWAAAAVCFFAQAASGGALTVHEWGLVTCLQDEAGKEIGGINVEDELLASSMHEADPGPFLPVTRAADNRNPPRSHAEVNLRVERAVIRFYPEPGSEMAVDVTMNLFGGWPTHYLPAASTSPEPFGEGFGGLPWLQIFRGQLEWREVHLAAAEGERTSAWLDVKGERETALAYRVLANRNAPLQVVRDGAEFIITSRRTETAVDRLWLVDARADGRIAFRVLHPVEPELAFLIRTPVGFSADEYSGENRALLREALRDAAAAAGLSRVKSRRCSGLGKKPQAVWGFGYFFSLRPAGRTASCR